MVYSLQWKSIIERGGSYVNKQQKYAEYSKQWYYLCTILYVFILYTPPQYSNHLAMMSICVNKKEIRIGKQHKKNSGRHDAIFPTTIGRTKTSRVTEQSPIYYFSASGNYSLSHSFSLSLMLLKKNIFSIGHWLKSYTFKLSQTRYTCIIIKFLAHFRSSEN